MEEHWVTTEDGYILGKKDFNHYFLKQYVHSFKDGQIKIYTILSNYSFTFFENVKNRYA